MIVWSVCFESNITKPSWCFVVKTMYFIPASLAILAHWSALNFTGLKCL